MKNKKVDTPWGWEIYFASTDKYVGKLSSIKEGSSLELSTHTIFCLEGRANITVVKETTTEILLLTPGYSYYFDKSFVIEAKEDTVFVSISENTRN